MNWIDVMCGIGGGFVLYLISLYGEHRACKRERARVEGLLNQAFQAKGSASVRWVWNAVSSGKDTLMDEDRFFGPKKD